MIGRTANGLLIVAPHAFVLRAAARALLTSDELPRCDTHVFPASKDREEQELPWT